MAVRERRRVLEGKEMSGELHEDYLDFSWMGFSLSIFVF